MYPTPLNETLIKTKTYRDCSESFAITDKVSTQSD